VSLPRASRARVAGGKARARLIVLVDEVLARLDVDAARLVLEQSVAAYGQRLLRRGLLGVIQLHQLPPLVGNAQLLGGQRQGGGGRWATLDRRQRVAPSQRVGLRSGGWPHGHLAASQGPSTMIHGFRSR